jgi:hypothetical protein
MKPIEQFIRETLGCQCPDEVFGSISLDHPGAADGAIPYTRLIVGNRLLIYILDAASSRVADGALADLVARGCRERIEHRYNRFRLVIARDEPDSVAAGTRHVFERATGQDEHAHLHCVRPELLPPELRR